MSKTGVFYGPSKGSVAKVANLLSTNFGIGNCDLKLAKDAKAKDLEGYNKIILGLSTIGKANWNSFHKDNDWDIFIDELDKTNWKDKIIAIYCLGDQMTYPNNFVDAIGWIYEKLEKNNAKVVGFCSTEGYQFIESEGVRDNQFLGLPIDEDNESDKTEIRIKNWIDQLKNEGF